MRIQPRQQLLEIWRAIARSALVDGEWSWGGRHQPNSISDAEQLLCLLGPAAEIPTFKLDLPNETAEDVLEALRPLGDSVEIPRRLIKVITQFYETYTDKATDTPTFAGGSYFTPVEPGQWPTEDQRDLHVVDSFSVSVRLSLATIGFVRVFRTVVRRTELRSAIDELEVTASKRLTAAMIGLLRSFTVHVFDPESEHGTNLCWMVNQAHLPTRQFVEDLQTELREIKAGLRDVTLGSGQVSDIDDDNKLFECGWSWGIVKDAPTVEGAEGIGEQRPGVAEDAPYLYFTVVALDCIRDLFSDRTRLLGLLNDEQQRLARALQLRWDLTQSYWSKIARFGRGQWPLEDLPWRTSDGVESDYLSLLVSSIVVQDLVKRNPPDSESFRVALVLQELAGRARLTRRPLAGDPAILLHTPGFPLELIGGDAMGGPRLCWRLADFAPQLLKQIVRVTGVLRQVDLYSQVASLADQVWETHLVRRRLPGGGRAAHLWDRSDWPDTGTVTADDPVSWYFTERVVQCLVAAADLLQSTPLRSPGLTTLATDLLAEADHLFDQEWLSVSPGAAPALGTALHAARSTLQRAHEIMRERPGTAYVLAAEVLRDLDRLAAARQKATWAG